MEFKPFKIGKYLLLEKLATGGMAEVYRAKASGAGGFEKQLAIKRILPTYSQNEEFRRMFEYEARLSSMLTHSNIVQIYDFVKSGETYLLAMEYVDGKNLRQFVNKAKKLNVNLPVEFGVYVINEVCKGLEYAHKKKDDLNGRSLNIIHRDMSPQNIMLSYDGATKIVDFGIAKAKDRVDETRSGVIKGKFGYMSPEQANGEGVDHRTDIFSTGIILFELLTGKRLFASENDMATLKLIQECVIPTPSRLNPKITSELERILMKALTKDMKLRYQDAGLFHRNLQEYFNKYFPTFTQKDVESILRKVFREEIEHEKRRFEQIHRQSIPFSQGDDAKNEGGDLDGVEEALDGSITKSEAGSNTAVTFIDDEVSMGGGVSPGDEISLPTGSDTGQKSLEDELSGGATQVEPVFADDGDQSLPTLGEESEKSVKPRKRKDSRIDSVILRNADDNTGSTTKNTESTKGGGSKTLVKDDRMPVISGSPGKRGEPEIIQSGTGTKKGSFLSKESGTDNNEIILGNEMSGSTGRRRDRSISAITEMSGQSGSDDPNTGLSLVTYSGAGAGSSAGPVPEKAKVVNNTLYYPEREDYVPKKRSAVFSFLVFCSVLAGTVYLYRLYLNGRVPELIRILSPGGGGGGETPIEPTPQPMTKADPPPENPNIDRKPVGDCTIRIDTDPPGAKVFVDGKERGVSSATISAPCNQAVDITLRREGYESISENVVMKEKTGRIYKTLREIPMGTLSLTLNRNSMIYIDGNLVGEAKADVEIDIPVRANKKNTVQFVNEILGINTVREFVVEKDQIMRRALKLEEPAPLPNAPRRRN